MLNPTIHIHTLQSTDSPLMELVAGWYLDTWKIPVEKTLRHLGEVTAAPSQMQVVLFEGDVPIATGGVYHQVGLLDREPRLRIHPHWLALVYTVPAYRNQGFGAQVCRHLQSRCQEIGIASLHLFTDSAESLYTSLGWNVLERIETAGRNLTIMQIDLRNK